MREEIDIWLLSILGAFKFGEFWHPPIFGRPSKAEDGGEMQNLRAVDLGLSETGKPTVLFFSSLYRIASTKKSTEIPNQKLKRGQKSGIWTTFPAGTFSTNASGFIEPFRSGCSSYQWSFVRSKRGKSQKCLLDLFPLGSKETFPSF